MVKVNTPNTLAEIRNMATAETSAKAGALGRWSLHGKMALITGGTRGIG
jgi:hypothetical protein